jgi:hypothetical protein
MEQQGGRVSKASLQKKAWLGVLALMLAVPSVSAPQVSSGQADSQANAPDLNTIVQSLETAEQQNPAKIKGYTVTRSYKLFHGDALQPVSETTAEISFIPPSTKRYEIKHNRVVFPEVKAWCVTFWIWRVFRPKAVARSPAKTMSLFFFDRKSLAVFSFTFFE